MKGKFAVKTEIGSFNGVSPDIKLEKTIHSKAKKSAASFIGQTRQLSYVKENLFIMKC